MKTILEWTATNGKLPADGSDVLIYTNAGWVDGAEFVEHCTTAENQFNPERIYKPRFITATEELAPDSVAYWCVMPTINKQELKK